MTAPTPDPHPDPEPFPQPTPKPASPDETPVTIVDLPPNQPSPGVPVDKPLPATLVRKLVKARIKENKD